jgi:hypothetical protein
VSSHAGHAHASSHVAHAHAHALATRIFLRLTSLLEKSTFLNSNSLSGIDLVRTLSLLSILLALVYLSRQKYYFTAGTILITTYITIRSDEVYSIFLEASRQRYFFINNKRAVFDDNNNCLVSTICICF